MHILPWFLSKTANPTRIVAEIRRRQAELHHLEPAEKFIMYNSVQISVVIQELLTSLHLA